MIRSASAKAARERPFLSEEDRLLLERDFTVEDPEQVPNLVERLPEISGAPKIIAKYHIKDHTRPRIRCSKCGERVHWKGYVLELPNGQHALLAERHCGRDAFGLKWDQVEREFLQQESRQADLVRLEKIRAVFPAFGLEIEHLRSHDQVRAYDRYFYDLRHNFGPLSRGMAKSPKQLGLFVAEILVRNTEAEYARARRQVPDLVRDAEDVSGGPAERQKNHRRLEKWLKQQDPIWKTEPVRLGACLGDGILRSDTPAEMLGKAIERANALQRMLDTRTSAEWTAPALAEGFKSFGQLADEIDDVYMLLGKFERFNSPKNIARLAEWATRDHAIPGSYRAEGSTVVDERGNRLAPSCTLGGIPAPAFEKFLEAFGRPVTYAQAA